MTPPAATSYQVFSVGQRLPDWKAPTSQGIRFALKGDEPPILTFMYRQPTAEETTAFLTAPMQFGLLPAGSHTFFLLVKVPVLLIGWGDAPFALGLLSPDSQAIPRPKPGRGWLLTMVLADADDGRIHGLRALTWSPPFSQLLADLIAEQQRHLTTFSIEQHRQEIAAAYQRYPGPNDMAAHALTIETGGIPFPQPN